MSIQVISFHCILRNKAGKVLSSTFNKDVITSPEDLGTPLKGLTQGLQDLQAGEKRKIAVNAEEAYGFYDPQKVILFPRSKVPQAKQLKVGSAVEIISKTGTKRKYSVQQLHTDFITLDGNHPLAGQDLIFEIEAVSAREATREELQEALNPMSTQYLN